MNVTTGIATLPLIQSIKAHPELVAGYAQSCCGCRLGIVQAASGVTLPTCDCVHRKESRRPVLSAECMHSSESV